MNRWSILVALPLLTGCVSKPVLELYGGRVAGVSPQGVLLTLTMKVNNDNSFDVRIRNVRANVNLQHRYDLPYLQYNPDQWLGSDASTLVAVPMVIPWQLVTPLLTTSVGSPMVQYHVHGLADVTATRLLQIQRNDYMLDEEGSFSRFDLVVAAGRGVLGDVDPHSDDALALRYPAWLESAMDGALASNEPASNAPSTDADHCFGCQPFGYGGATTRQEPSEATAE